MVLLLKTGLLSLSQNLLLMIQRIQTVYLALAILSMALMFAFKISYIETGDDLAVITVYGVTLNDQAVQNSWLVLPPWAWNVLIIAALVSAVVLYRNRRRQMLLARTSSLLIIAYFVVLYFAGTTLADSFTGVERPSYGVSTYFPVAAFAFVFLANRAIKKDEDLVRSLDRLR
ncbi:MAG: DUF4293 family protein [Cryomorphaceae bacterium]|nr:MAG: DUF4293 family protein [Cryomorphaceae bacterium]